MAPSLLGKFYTRWAESYRPTLLPKEDKITARMAEIRNVRTWTSNNVETLLDCAYDVRIVRNTTDLESAIRNVELDYYTWGVDNNTCKRLVDECYKTYFF